MNIILTILSFLGIGLLGMIFYTFYKSRNYIISKEFNLNIFWNENKRLWFWSFVMLLLISLLVVFLPEIAPSIKSITGLDVTGELASFFTLGYGLSALSKGVEKTKNPIKK